MNTLAVQQRQVARCTHCGMNQFVTVSGLCRGCHKGLLPPVLEVKPEAPAPLALIPVPAKLDIASTIRELRRQRHLSQRDLAARMCVARTYISKVEADKNTPTLPLLARFAKGLGVDISTLLGEPNMRDPFLSEIASYVSNLNDEQRSAVLSYARGFSR